jgi:hypothetical protein
MEINDPETITAAQAEMIKDHLDLTLSEMAKKKANQNQQTITAPQQGGSTSVSPYTIYSHPIALNTLIC